MPQVAPNGDINYCFTTATTFFINVYKNYFKKHCTKKSIDQRVRDMRKKLKKSDIPKMPSIGGLRRKLKSTQKDYFEKYRMEYFMIDLFPENENRFMVSYQDVIK